MTTSIYQDERFDNCKFCNAEVRRGEWHIHFPCDSYKNSLKAGA